MYDILYDIYSQASEAALLHELKGQRSTNASGAIKKPELYSVVKYILQQGSCHRTEGKWCTVRALAAISSYDNELFNNVRWSDFDKLLFYSYYPQFIVQARQGRRVGTGKMAFSIMLAISFVSC